MFINDNYPDNTPFRDLAVGEVFYNESHSDYFMVIQEFHADEIDCEVYNAVSLTRGYLEFFTPKEIVRKVRGEFKVK